MCLDHFHFLLQDPPLSFLSAHLCVFCGGIYVFLKIKTNLCCSNIPGCVIFLCSMVDLAGATLLEKFMSPYPSNYHLPIAPHRGREFLSTSHNAGIWFDLSLYRSYISVSSYVQLPCCVRMIPLRLLQISMILECWEDGLQCRYFIWD